VIEGWKVKFRYGTRVTVLRDKDSIHDNGEIFEFLGTNKGTVVRYKQHNGLGMPSEHSNLSIPAYSTYGVRFDDTDVIEYFKPERLVVEV
jgi:hypothetical protein